MYGKYPLSDLLQERYITFLLFELFCIPIINSKNREKLNVNVKNIFLKGNNIF